MDNALAQSVISSFRETQEERLSPRITKRGVGIVLSVWSVYTLLAAFPQWADAVRALTRGE